jgi:hypothetical protein
MVLAVSIAAAGLVMVVAQSAAETYTATATAKMGADKQSREVTIRVTRFASDQERAAAIKAAKESSAAARKVLAGFADAGVIQVGERKAVIKYAYKRSKGPGAGDLLTVATSDPLGFLGSDQPGAQSTAGFDVAIALMDLKSDGTGTGELAPAAKVSMDENGALRMQDYAASTVVWLNGIKRAAK